MARVTGTVTATAKQASLTGAKLMVTDVIDGAGTVLAPAVVAIDTCGAGVGDTVLLAQGSAARVASGLATLPVDASIVAVVDSIDMAPPRTTKTSASTRRKT